MLTYGDFKNNMFNIKCMETVWKKAVYATKIGDGLGIPEAGK